MILYLLKRVLYAIPILLGVNLITFSLFFLVNTPDDMARMQLGNKNISSAQVQLWKQQNGYDAPLFFNHAQQGVETLTQTLFYKKSMDLFTFHFGASLQGRDIGFDITERMWPSLAIAVPTLLLGLVVNITFSLFAALFLSLPVAFWLIMCRIIDQGAGGATHYVTGETFPFVVAPRSHLTESLSLAAFALLIGVFFRTAALFKQERITNVDDIKQQLNMAIFKAPLNDSLESALLEDYFLALIEILLKPTRFLREEKSLCSHLTLTPS